MPYFTGLPKIWYSNPQISPDGTKIAYLKNMGVGPRTLVVSDIDGKNVKVLTNDIEWTMPFIQWSKDSQQIYYPSSGKMGMIVVSSVNITTGQKQEYGQFTMASGCGGISPDPADHLSAEEGIIQVGGGVQVFNLSPQNDFIVHTISCTGIGLGILDLSSKQDKKLDDRVMRAVISPDGKSIAAVLGLSIVIFNADSGTIQMSLPTPENPLVLLWGIDGKTIYYSSLKLQRILNFDNKLAFDLFGTSDIYYQVNTSTLWKLSLDTGKSEKIIDFDAHNIKPIYSSNKKLLVVIVENATALHDYISQYKTKENTVAYYPKVKLTEINLSNFSSSIIADKVQQSFYLPQ